MLVCAWQAHVAGRSLFPSDRYTPSPVLALQCWQPGTSKVVRIVLRLLQYEKQVILEGSFGSRKLNPSITAQSAPDSSGQAGQSSWSKRITRQRRIRIRIRASLVFGLCATRRRRA